MTDPTSGSLRERLRAATAEAHCTLERDLDWKSRITTLRGYRDLLAELYGFHAGYEPAIGRALADEGFFGPRRRLGQLAADLQTLDSNRAHLAGLPIVAPIVIDGAPAAFGALYVLEGSTLGGQVIRRALERRHGAHVACAYYRAHGPATLGFWKTYCDELERRCADPNSACAALRAGVETFEALRLWLTARTGAEAA